MAAPITASETQLAAGTPVKLYDSYGTKRRLSHHTG